mmetsp:Transcript_32475/g.92034  ORF Transcript_32475/g.92034 Transcript_32475/m.92034 type:complete len:303 (-) Transcript_32475:171-1079(-)
MPAGDATWPRVMLNTEAPLASMLDSEASRPPVCASSGSSWRRKSRMVDICTSQALTVCLGSPSGVSWLRAREVGRNTSSGRPMLKPLRESSSREGSSERPRSNAFADTCRAGGASAQPERSRDCRHLKRGKPYAKVRSKPGAVLRCKDITCLGIFLATYCKSCISLSLAGPTKQLVRSKVCHARPTPPNSEKERQTVATRPSASGPPRAYSWANRLLSRWAGRCWIPALAPHALSLTSSSIDRQSPGQPCGGSFFKVPVSRPTEGQSDRATSNSACRNATCVALWEGACASLPRRSRAEVDF